VCVCVCVCVFGLQTVQSRGLSQEAVKMHISSTLYSTILLTCIVCIAFDIREVFIFCYRTIYV